MALWVFGYGSLLWNPGFEPQETVLATCSGYARSFCMLSIHHRGTLDDPGLVLALDAAQNSSCAGVAFLVPKAQEAAVLAGLRERELVSSAYLERTVAVTLSDGRQIDALTYIIDPDHDQYCHFDLERQAQIIAKAVGGRGPNTEYLYNTVEKLASLGIADADLEWLANRVRDLEIQNA